MNLFNLVATLVLNKQAYEQGLKDAEKDTSSFSSKAGVAFKNVTKVVTAVIGVVTALGAGIVKAINSFTDFTNEIDDNAKALQLSTEEYQRLDWLFKQMGADSSTMQQAMRQLADMTTKLAEGDADAILQLQRLGIAYEDFMEMSPYEQFETIVEAFQDMEQGIEKTTLAQEIFGNRAYQKLMPALNESKGYLDAFNERLDRLGVILSDDTVEGFQNLGDEVLFLKGQVKNLAINFISDMLPALSDTVKAMQDWAAGTEGAAERVKEGISNVVDQFVTKIPDILILGGDLLFAILDGLIAGLGEPETIEKLFDFVEKTIFNIIELLPTILQTITTLVPAIIKGLLTMDWGMILVKLIEVIIVDLPTAIADLVMNLMDMLVDIMEDPAGALKKIAQIGKGLAQALINSMVSGIESGINLIITAINSVTKSLSKAWTWAGIPAIPQIDKISLPKVNWMAEGGMFDGIGTLYGVGEHGAEIIAQGKHGTGVTNVEQIQEAMYNALAQIAPVLVNGIVQGMSINRVDGTNNITIKIGEQEFKSYIVRASNENLNQKGRKTLNKVTRYG